MRVDSATPWGTRSSWAGRGGKTAIASYRDHYLPCKPSLPCGSGDLRLPGRPTDTQPAAYLKATVAGRYRRLGGVEARSRPTLPGGYDLGTDTDGRRLNVMTGLVMAATERR